jgi:hypothetical protein
MTTYFPGILEKLYPLKIDAYSHIAPPKYKELLRKVAPQECANKVDPTPPLYDLDHRFRIMDRFEGLVQVIAPAWPSVEEVATPKKAVDLAKLANDEMALWSRNIPIVRGGDCLSSNE